MTAELATEALEPPEDEEPFTFDDEEVEAALYQLKLEQSQ